MDQSAFILGEQERSNRDSVIVYLGDTIYGVKWRNWKVVTRELDSGFGVPGKEYATPNIYNLLLDPREEYRWQLGAERDLWVR